MNSSMLALGAGPSPVGSRFTNKTSLPLHICIAPPRSGLSVLSGCLRILGFVSPERQPDASTINALLLQDLGLASETVGSLEDGWSRTDAALRAKDRIERLLGDMRFSNQPYYLSDSNFCRLLPIWEQSFKRAGIDTRYTFLIRHPWEVAMALKKNKGIDLDETHVLWLTYVCEALRVLGDREHAILTFDQLLSDPLRALNPTDAPFLDRRSEALLYFVHPDLKTNHANALPEKEKLIYEPFARLYSQIQLAQQDDYHSLINEFYSCSAGDSFLNTIGKQEKQATSRQHGEKRNTGNSGRSLFARVLFPVSEDGGGVEENIPLIEDKWQKIVLSVPESKMLKHFPILMRPLNFVGTVKIFAINILNKASGKCVWQVNKSNGFEGLIILGQAIRIPARNPFVLAALGQNSQIKLQLNQDIPDCPLGIEIWIKVSSGSFEIENFFNKNKYTHASHAIFIGSCFSSTLKEITSLGNFHRKFKARSNEYKKITEERKSLVTGKTFWGSTIQLLPQNEVVSSKIYSFGLFEPELCGFFIDYLRHGAVVIDVGAHIGFFSMLAAELVGEHGSVFSFEPTPSTREILKLNLKMYPKAMIVEKLAWFEKTEVEFHDFGTRFSAFNTAVSARLSPEQKEMSRDNCIKVEAIPLDRFCKDQDIQPDLVKIDAESSELQVLKGMTSLLNVGCRPVITLEVGDMESTLKDGVPHSRELIEFVMRYDYSPLNAVGGRYQFHELKNHYEYDNIIFVPEEKLPAGRISGPVAVQRGYFF